MAFDVVTTARYDEALETAVTYRLSFFGSRSARALLVDQEALESRLAAFPFSGAPVDTQALDTSGDVLRWSSVGPYVAIYETDSVTKRVILELLFYSREDWRAKVGKVTR